MKKIMTIVLGLAVSLAMTSLTFAEDDKRGAEKQSDDSVRKRKRNKGKGNKDKGNNDKGTKKKDGQGNQEGGKQ
ncbi:MAG: hypothetical protein FJW39_34295 [Acidobacteria bacterium]|nr:hypothetical protein [Acidobacteriota bacterium]